jgi:hypothetical protein
MRHLMKLYYSEPRLISVVGQNSLPEVYEFTRDSIDEQADVRIEPDSLMPMLRSARVDMIRGMFSDGLFGDPKDAITRKRVLDMIRMGGYADFEIDREQRDQEQAQLENIQMTRNEPLDKPQVWEDHRVHWESHVDLFKSSESRGWPEPLRVAYAWHALIHLSYLSEDDALKMSGEFGLRDKLEQLLALRRPPPPTPPPTPMAPEAPPSPEPPPEALPPDALQDLMGPPPGPDVPEGFPPPPPMPIPPEALAALLGGGLQG